MSKSISFHSSNSLNKHIKLIEYIAHMPSDIFSVILVNFNYVKECYILQVNKILSRAIQSIYRVLSLFRNLITRICHGSLFKYTAYSWSIHTVQPGPIHATRFSSITILFLSHPVCSWPFHISVFLLHSYPTYSKPSRNHNNTCTRLLYIAIEHVLSRKRTQYVMFVQLFNMITVNVNSWSVYFLNLQVSIL